MTANSSRPRNSCSFATSSSALMNSRWIFCHLKQRKKTIRKRVGCERLLIECNKFMPSNYRSLDSLDTFETVPTQQLHSPAKEQIVSAEPSDEHRRRILPRWMKRQLRGFDFWSITVSTNGTLTIFTNVLHRKGLKWKQFELNFAPQTSADYSLSILKS